MLWLERVPQGLVRAYLTMLPRLEAEERIASVAAGSLRLPQEAAEEQARAWNRATAGLADGEARRLTPRQMGAAGIGVRRVKRNG